VQQLVPPDATEFLARFARVRVKTLIIWGDRDGIRPLSHGRRLAKDLPDARLEVMEGIGHIPNQEVPGRVNKLILDAAK